MPGDDDELSDREFLHLSEEDQRLLLYREHRQIKRMVKPMFAAYYAGRIIWKVTVYLGSGILMIGSGVAAIFTYLGWGHK